MSGTGQRFDPSELEVPGEPASAGAERADLLLAARALESVTADGVRPTDGFEDRVMAAIALEAAPKLVLRPGTGVRGGRAAVFLIAVRDAWGVAIGGGRPLGVRAQALAFVLLFVVAVGSVTGAATVTPFASWSIEREPRSSGPAIESSAISMKPKMQPRRHS